MAHYVAELINRAETIESASDRLKAKKEAEATILRIWKHRDVLPGKAYPLAACGSLVAFLRLLHPEASPFHGKSVMERAAAELFKDLPLLFVSLILASAPQLLSVPRQGTAVNALTAGEKELLAILDQWFSLLSSGKQRAKSQKRKKKKGSVASRRVDFDAGVFALERVESCLEALQDLRKQLQK